MSGNESAAPALEFSLVRGGPLYNLRQAVGLVPEKGLGLAKRAATIVAFTWLPIVLGAIVEKRFFPGQSADPLLRHFGVHARLLIAIPLLIFAEAPMEQIVPAITRQFTLGGFIAGPELDEFAQVLRRAEALRDSIWGKLLALGAIAWTVTLPFFSPLLGDELAWAAGDQPGQIRFAGWWFLCVGRPIFVGLMAIWVWRLFIGWRLIRGISALNLQLVPSHPDRAGGLGFVQRISVADAWIVFAMSVVLAGRWGHEVLYHGTHVDSLKPLVAVYTVLILIVFMGPLLLFSRNLRHCKHRALMQYSALVGEQGRLVYRKWIFGQDVGEPPILDSPELGCVADTNTIFDAVEKMRVVPLGKEALIPLVLAIAIPMIPVFAIEVPVKDLLLKIGTSLV